MKLTAKQDHRLENGVFWQKGDTYDVKRNEAGALLAEHADVFAPADDEAKELAKLIAGGDVVAIEAKKVFGAPPVKVVKR